MRGQRFDGGRVRKNKIKQKEEKIKSQQRRMERDINPARQRPEFTSTIAVVVVGVGTAEQRTNQGMAWRGMRNLPPQ